MTDIKQETEDTFSHNRPCIDATHMDQRQHQSQELSIWPTHPSYLCMSDENLALQRASALQRLMEQYKGPPYTAITQADIDIALAGEEGPPLEQLVMPDNMQWDLQLAFPLIHISFLLKHLIPRKTITKIFSKWTEEKLLNDVRKSISNLPEDNIEIEIVGSMSEGIPVPGHGLRSVHWQGNPNDMHINASDCDVCFILADLKVGLVPGDTMKFILDTENTYPGYCRLVVINPEKVTIDLITKKSTSPKVFFNSNKLNQHLLQGSLKGNDQYPDESGALHGPAISNDLKKTLITKKIDNDFVSALPCPQWPKDAANWSNRAPKSGWPSTDLKNQLISDGCLIVAVAHSSSEWPEVEWRISFAKVEKALAHTLGDIHRQCVILLKVLLKHVLKPSKVLTSYHIKTLLFWTCEKYPVSIWKDKEVGLAACFLLLLDELLHAIASQHLPHYFIPANNLFSHIHPDFLADMGAKVSWLRCNLLQAVFSFDKTYVFLHSPRQTTLEWIFQPMIDDASTQYQNIQRAYETYTLILIHLAKTETQDCLIDNMIDSLREVCQIKKVVFNTDIDFMPLALNIAKQANAECALATYERLIRRFPSHRSIAGLKSDLAGLYHNCFYDKQFTSDKDGMLQRATLLYEEAIGDHRASASTWTDYANFCIKEALIDKANESAQIAIGLAQSEENSGNSYSESEKLTVPSDIQQDIDQDKSFVVRSESYARYLLVLSYIQARNRKQAEKLMEEFQNVILRMPGGRVLLTDWKLVGYGWKALEMYAEAKCAFDEGLKLHPGSEAAIEAKLLCEAMLMSLGT